jgi:hypothetical protein
VANGKTVQTTFFPEAPEEESYDDDGNNVDKSVKAIEPEDKTAKEEELQLVVKKYRSLDYQMRL